MEIFGLNGASDMAPFWAIKFQEQILRLKWSPDLNIHRPWNRFTRHEAKDIVIKIDVDCAFKVEI